MKQNPVIKLTDVSFFYTGENQQGAGVEHINLEINRGQVVVLTGESGCGKTTVTRLLNGLIPHYFEGEPSGEISVCGQNVWRQPLYESAKIIGSVFQNPRSQFFNVDTTSEITFGCENLGMEVKEIEKRLLRVTEEFHLSNLLDRNIFMLSGGEKQKIACSGISIMEPEVFILDEPSSNLDGESVEELRKILAYWKKQGKTIIISEHRLYYLKDLADSFVYMQKGRIVRNYSREEFTQLTEEERSHMGLRGLVLPEIAENGISFYQKNGNPENINKNINSAGEGSGTDQYHLVDFCFVYKHQPPVLKIADARIPAQGITAITGRNGAGKSTFSRALCGLLKKCGKLEMPDGKILNWKGRLKNCYMVMQDVNHQLFTESVMEEVLISMEEEDVKKALEILEKLDLADLKDRHPMSLSGGQKQRVAIACALASGQKILILDEPTSGLDLKHMQETAAVLKELAKENISVYVVTHDPEFIKACCTGMIRIEDGKICSVGCLNG